MFGTNIHAAKIYKWVDESGKTHYSDRGPPDSQQVEELLDWSSPASGQDVDTRMQRTQRLLNSFRQERVEKREKRQAAAEKKRKRKANCTRAKNTRIEVSEASRFYNRDENGQRVYLNDEQHEQYRAKVEQAVKKWCN